MKRFALLAVLIASPSVGAEPERPQPGLLAELEFGEGSARLPEGFGSQLGQVAAWAADHFDGLVVIDGHADARGPAAGNVRLSLRRARLVREQLIAIGVDPSQIIISAFGPEGRASARVAVWGNENTIESVIAKRKPVEERAKDRATPTKPHEQTPREQTRHARPSRARQR
jgi:hypothetical protein